MRALIVFTFLLSTLYPTYVVAQEADPFFRPGSGGPLKSDKLYLLEYSCELNEGWNRYLRAFRPAARSATHYFSISTSGNPENISAEQMLNGGFSGAQNVFTINDGNAVGSPCRDGMLFIKGNEQPRVTYALKVDNDRMSDQGINLLVGLSEFIAPTYRLIRAKDMNSNDQQGLAAAKTVLEKAKEFQALFPRTVRPGGAQIGDLMVGNNNVITRASLVNIRISPVDKPLLNSQFKFRDNIDKLIKIDIPFDQTKIEESCTRIQIALYNLGLKSNLDAAFVIYKNSPYVKKSEIIDCLGTSRLVDSVLQNLGLFSGYVQEDLMISRDDVIDYNWVKSLPARDEALAGKLDFVAHTLSRAARKNGELTNQQLEKMQLIMNETITVSDETSEDLITPENSSYSDTEHETKGPWQQQIRRIFAGGLTKFYCVRLPRAYPTIQAYDGADGMMLAGKPAVGDKPGVTVALRFKVEDGRVAKISVTPDRVPEAQALGGNCVQGRDQTATSG